MVAGRIIFNLPPDTRSEAIIKLTQWNSIYDLYKLSPVKLLHNTVSDNKPQFIPD